MKKRTVLIALILLVSLVLPIKAEAHQPLLRWTVRFGMERQGIWMTRWFAKSDPAGVYDSTTYFRLGFASGVQMTVSEEGVTRWIAGPPHMYEASGFALAEAGAQMAFAGMRWRSGACLPGPTITMIRREGKTRLLVKNSTNVVLFVSTSNGKWRRLLPGKSYSRGFSSDGRVELAVQRGGLSCASAWWR